MTDDPYTTTHPPRRTEGHKRRTGEQRGAAAQPQRGHPWEQAQAAAEEEAQNEAPANFAHRSTSRGVEQRRGKEASRQGKGKGEQNWAADERNAKGDRQQQREKADKKNEIVGENGRDKYMIARGGSQQAVGDGIVPIGQRRFVLLRILRLLFVLLAQRRSQRT